MSQHDMVLDDAGGAAFLADVNDAIKALASNSIGTSAPATRYAGQTWIDSAANPWVEKRWTGAAWVIVGYINTSTGIWTPAGANSIDPGICVEYYGTTAPSGWLFPYGQAVSRSTYAALFAALGTTYGGGDGSTTFNLPDRRDKVGIGRGNMGGTPAGLITDPVTGLNTSTLGAVGGSQSASSVPSHTHPYVRTIIDDSGSYHVGNYAYLQKVNLGDPNSAGVRFAGENTNATGVAGGVSKLPPGIVCNFLIKT